MKVEENEDKRVYQVVVNHEGQYSIWLETQAIPVGWKATGKIGPKSECLEHIKAVWTDLTPLSLRR